MAERMGFEPMVRSRESLVFKTSSINHSDTSPQWLPPECRYYYTKIRRGCQPLRTNFFENYLAVDLTVNFLLRFAQMFFVLGPSALRQHRIIPALRLKHRFGGCGTASALPKCSPIHKVLPALLA